MSSQAAGSLRAITYRLSSAPVKQLPILIPHIVTALLDCKNLLAAPSSPSKESSDAVVVHKFRTQLSTFLNDKSCEARWAAIVLLKATIELGGWEILQTCGPWVRGLLSVLSKPDPPSTKNLCIMTLTRIFMLTQDYPTLLREITTPSLPAFATACLNLVSLKTHIVSVQQLQGQRVLLPTVLESFRQLLPRHPNTFRSFHPQLRNLLLPFIGVTPSSTRTQPQNLPAVTADPKVVEAAQTLFALLPFCAPKTSSHEEWSTSLAWALSEAHSTADQVFRAIIEDWQSFAGHHPQLNGSQTPFDREVIQASPTSSGLPEWSGIHAGCERLTRLFGLIQRFITCQTAAPVPFPIGCVADLLVRVLSVTVPSSREAGGDSAEGMRTNSQICKEEREALWAELPNIHAAAIEAIESLSERFRSSCLPLVQMFVDQITWVFRHEKCTALIRHSSYATLTSILNNSGGAFTKDMVSQLSSVIVTCCEDILPTGAESISHSQSFSGAKRQQGKSEKGSMNADTFLQTSKLYSSRPASSLELVDCALNLLTICLAQIPAQHMSMNIRSLMDRTAVLSNSRSAMLASVLNPPPHNKLAKAHSSILPLLARAWPDSLEVEACIRPRLPVLKTSYREVDGEDEDRGWDELSAITEQGLDESRKSTAYSAEVNMEDDEIASQEAPISSAIQLAILEDQKQDSASASILDSQEWSNKLAPETHPTATPEVEYPPNRRKRASPVDQTGTPEPKRVHFDASVKSVAVETDADSGSSRDVTVIPMPVVIDEPTHPAPGITINTTMVSAEAIQAPDLGAGDSEDDDNFEIPELTLEPDTEDDEDNEDNEDDRDELGQP